MKNSFLRKTFLFLMFIFLFFYFFYVNAEQNLNISEKWLGTDVITTIGTFTTGDITPGTTSTLRLEGKDTHAQNNGIIYIYLNGTQILYKDVSIPYDINRVTVYTNTFTLQPNTTYTITAKAVGQTCYIRNIISTVNIDNIKPIIGSIISDVTSIDIDNESNVGFTLNGINDQNQGDNLTFKYSFDNINYVSLDGNLAGPVNNGSFSFSLNLYDKPEGNITLYVKANDGITDSQPVQITLNKDTSIPEPEVNLQVIDLDTELGTKKLTITTEYGDIFYNINTSGICNDTLQFTHLDGDLTFEYGVDNGKYVCYKINYGKWQSMYKISSKISGINGIMEYRRGDVFGGFKNWKSSSLVKEGDKTLAFLKMMGTTNKSGTVTSVTFPTNLVDINGDGLIDMLYSSYSTWDETRFTTTGTYQYRINSYKYAILINNGDYTFNPVYRCVFEDNKYYGDCVDLIDIEE